MKYFDESLHFKLFSNVIPVKGFNRSIIMDLLKQRSYFVPNSYVDMFNDYDFDFTPLNQILEQIEDELERKVIIDYVNFSIENDFALLGSSQVIKGLNLIAGIFFPSSKINNSILEISTSSNWNVKEVLIDLNELGTKHVEFRFLDFTSYVNHIESIIENIKKSSIESVILFIPNNKGLKKHINKNILNQIRISKIVVYNSNTGFALDNSSINIVFSSQNTIGHDDCGQVSSSYFTIQTDDYINNLNNNNCLAYKICVDSNGEIKNCPSSQLSYGNVLNNSLCDIEKNDDFKSLWKITKNEISVCSTCEFRMMCSDCRVFIDNPNNVYSRPSKCSYNPYISLWEDDDNYVNFQKSGVDITGNEVIINHEKLKIINDKIWS